MFERSEFGQALKKFSKLKKQRLLSEVKVTQCEMCMIGNSLFQFY
jgi:hypothetical protein